MNIHHHYHYHVDDDIRALIHQVLQRIGEIKMEIDRLREEVAEATTVGQSVVTLVQGLAQQLRDMAEQAADFEALKTAILEEADKLDATNQAIATAVQENTPTPPAPPV